jgi:hypothetical protein
MTFSIFEIVCILHDRKILKQPREAHNQGGQFPKYWRIHPRFRWVIDAVLIVLSVYGLFGMGEYIGIILLLTVGLVFKLRFAMKLIVPYRSLHCTAIILNFVDMGVRKSGSRREKDQDVALHNFEDSVPTTAA